MSKRAWKFIFTALMAMHLGTHYCPAPLVYTPGEGWRYENPGDDRGWRADRAEDQLEITRLAQEAGDYDLAYRSAKRLLTTWPLSDFAAEAQFQAAESLMLEGKYQQAFKEYQVVVDIYPKSERYEMVLQRQYEIATKYLNGERTRILWGYVPWMPSMKKAIEMNQQVIRNGPYTEFAGQAQVNIGRAHEKKKGFFLSFSEKYTKAADAYEKAAYRYFERDDVAADALFLAGTAYFRQARTGEYDQGHSDKAIRAYEDFISQFPDDERIEIARENISSLRSEQSRGAFLIARFYERKKELESALIYYNEAITLDPDSEFADRSREKISSIQEKLGTADNS